MLCLAVVKRMSLRRLCYGPIASEDEIEREMGGRSETCRECCRSKGRGHTRGVAR